MAEYQLTGPHHLLSNDIFKFREKVVVVVVVVQ